MKESIQEIVTDLRGKSIEEMKTYLKNIIDSYDVKTYKDMDKEMKFYIYKLYSFLYFCNECDNLAHVQRCILNLENAKTFKDRTVIINLLR